MAEQDWFCIRCGVSSPSDVAFCGSCGIPVQGDSHREGTRDTGFDALSSYDESEYMGF